MSAKRRIGFTLVEVLIVVVIMAILAATIIPQFSDSSKDAKESNLRFNLHTLRSQIELYKSQHDGVVPQTANLRELSNKTNLAGDLGNTRTHKFGPYIRQIPANPFTDSNSVLLITVTPATIAQVTANDGWLYHQPTGEIWINHADYVSE